MSFHVSASAEVEKVVLGICLLEDSAALELIASLLRPEHFSLDTYMLTFRAILRLHAANQPVNILTVTQELSRSGDLETVTNARVSSLVDGVPRRTGEQQVRNYVERLKEFWRQRELQRLGEDVALFASEADAVSSSIVQTVTERLEGIVDDSADEDASAQASVLSFLDRFYANRQLTGTPGMSYGMPELDFATDGMMPGEQTALGAASGVGKTAFMAQAIWATLRAGFAVDAFLLEPTKAQIIARLISLATRLSYNAVYKSWKLPEHKESTVTDAAAKIAEMPLRMFARSSMTLDEVLGHARIGMRKFGTRLICTDYIQRLKVRSIEQNEQTRMKVGRVSTALADLVKSTQTHSLLLSQITTGRKSGALAMPTMYDFRESSQIENDAHTIILLHREYDETQGHHTENGAILVPKQRNGQPCNLKAWFDPNTAAWTTTPLPTQETWHDRM